jgi:hypothetical protein
MIFVAETWAGGRNLLDGPGLEVVEHDRLDGELLLQHQPSRLRKGAPSLS